MKHQLDLKWERFIKSREKIQGEVIQGPRQTKGFPHEMIKVMGRPKKLRKWGFKEENDRRSPVRVMKPE